MRKAIKPRSWYDLFRMLVALLIASIIIFFNLVMIAGGFWIYFQLHLPHPG